jgi:hypothetical protein
VIAAIGIIIQTAVVVATDATNQTILLVPVAAQLTTLVAREPAVRTIGTSLLANQSLALAQELRLVARNLTGVYAATDAHAIPAMTLR